MRINLFYILCCVSTLQSCNGNCPDETVEKIEWVTSYTKETKDTLVKYQVIEYKTTFISQTELRYKVTVANTNNTYNNKFYINFYQYTIDYYGNKNWTKTSTDTVSIKSNNRYEFVYVSDQASKFINFENAFYIHQIPIKYESYKNNDSLIKEKITLNSCEINIEAFVKEQKSIEKLFKEKITKNNGILLKENWSNGFLLNRMAWRIYENSNNLEELNHAITLVQRSIEIEKNYYNLDTYAALLYKTNNYETAQKIAENAIKIAKEDNIDFSDTKMLMKKFNAKNK
ncbi:hypothetical protein [Dokdonia sp.]|uniref:tetratricopeptide repeat protein n=1 Tax=Dokdonia sp. TaxID=2024995 RepID=UPI0032650DBF